MNATDVCQNPKCGKPFVPRNSRQRCCSSLCGSRLHYIENRQHIIDSNMTWAKNNPDRVRIYKRTMYRKDPARHAKVMRDWRAKKKGELS